MDSDFKEFIERFVSDHEAEAKDMLKDLIRIRSVNEDPVKSPEGEVFPFGKGVQDAFSYMLSRAESDGFDTANVDNYGGHIELKHSDDQPEDPVTDDAGSESNGQEKSAGTKDPVRLFGMLAHLDVVPEGDGWEHDPYSGDEEDGFIWGRGTTDDKGPIVAAYFAMRAIKEYPGIRKDDIRLILGLDEETEWEGIEKYFDEMPKPDLGFTPDAFFPVLNGEKGRMTFKIAGKLKRTTLKGLELRKLSGGTAVNMVPGHARAVVNDRDPKVYDRIGEMAEAYELSTGHKIRVHKMGKSLELSADGVPAHGSTPEEGLNAVSILIGFLGQLNFVNDDISNFFDFYNTCISFDTKGGLLGCAMSDEQSGDLSMNVGLLEYDGKAISVTCDIRYPVTKTSDEVYEGIIPKIDEFGLGVLKESDLAPLYFDKDSDMIKTYLECYRDVTGDDKSEPIVVGGGTYARTCDNMVAFGGLFPGDPDIMHQRNEKIETGRILGMMRIYAEALYKFTVAR